MRYESRSPPRADSQDELKHHAQVTANPRTAAFRTQAYPGNRIRLSHQLKSRILPVAVLSSSLSPHSTKEKRVERRILCVFLSNIMCIVQVGVPMMDESTIFVSDAPPLAHIIGLPTSEISRHRGFLSRSHHLNDLNSRCLVSSRFYSSLHSFVAGAIRITAIIMKLSKLACTPRCR